MLHIVVKGQNSTRMLNKFQCRIPSINVIHKLWETRGNLLVILKLVYPLHMKNSIPNNPKQFVSEVRADLYKSKFTSIIQNFKCKKLSTRHTNFEN